MWGVFRLKCAKLSTFCILENYSRVGVVALTALLHWTSKPNPITKNSPQIQKTKHKLQ